VHGDEVWVGEQTPPDTDEWLCSVMRVRVRRRQSTDTWKNFMSSDIIMFRWRPRICSLAHNNSVQRCHWEGLVIVLGTCRHYATVCTLTVLVPSLDKGEGVANGLRYYTVFLNSN